MSKQMFFYAGVYDSASDAEADCSAIKSLNDSGAIGSYDTAIIVKQPDGQVKVTKTEKPAEHGAWVGAADADDRHAHGAPRVQVRRPTGGSADD